VDENGNTLTFAQLNPNQKKQMVGEAMFNARVRKQQGAARFGAGPQRIGSQYDPEETAGTGPDILAYLAQSGYSVADIVRNGVNVGGVKIPYNSMTVEEQEFVKNVLSKKGK
jgi:hypothetical protein